MLCRFEESNESNILINYLPQDVRADFSNNFEYRELMSIRENELIGFTDLQIQVGATHLLQNTSKIKMNCNQCILNLKYSDI